MIMSSYTSLPNTQTLTPLHSYINAILQHNLVCLLKGTNKPWNSVLERSNNPSGHTNKTSSFVNYHELLFGLDTHMMFSLCSIHSING